MHMQMQLFFYTTVRLSQAIGLQLFNIILSSLLRDNTGTCFTL